MRSHRSGPLLKLRERIAATAVRKRKLPREDLVKRCSEREDIRRRSDLLLAALLRGHVGVGTGNIRGSVGLAAARGPKIEQNGPPPGDDDVGRLHIEVKEAAAMNVLEGGADMDGDAHRLRNAHPVVSR